MGDGAFYKQYSLLPSYESITAVEDDYANRDSDGDERFRRRRTIQSVGQ